MSATEEIQLTHSIVSGTAHPNCRASIVIPARNEEANLPETLDALAAQVDIAGDALAADSFEILLLLNNCTDESANVARGWLSAHPKIHLHVVERTIEAPHAHVGTARRMLMDTACRRLSRQKYETCGILSTDSDSVVAPDWIAQNLLALERGADAVGGQIRLKLGDLEALPAGARKAYLRDRHYQRLVAQLEGILDPQPGDPLPRHLEHFGASLACTVQAYARVGGMPAVNPLEDVAFVDALLNAGACVRHEPSVVVYTSSRLDGRAEVGLSYQLRKWQRMSEEGKPHIVPSASWVTHRSRMLHQMRSWQESGLSPDLSIYPKRWRKSIAAAHKEGTPLIRRLGPDVCEQLIQDLFRGERDGVITHVNRNLARAISRWTQASNAPLQQPKYLQNKLLQVRSARRATQPQPQAPLWPEQIPVAT